MSPGTLPYCRDGGGGDFHLQNHLEVFPKESMGWSVPMGLVGKGVSRLFLGQLLWDEALPLHRVLLFREGARPWLCCVG